MTPSDALTTLIRPTLAKVGPPFESPDAECLLLAIGLQESGFLTRRQQPGPAHGFWQFETEAVNEFVRNGDERLQQAAWDTGVPNRMADLYQAILSQDGDAAACLMARDLLWHDPHTLPHVGDQHASWWYYLRNWRPGKPSLTRWQDFSYPQALKAMKPSNGQSSDS